MDWSSDRRKIMKTKNWLITGIALIAMMAISACGTTTATTEVPIVDVPEVPDVTDVSEVTDVPDPVVDEVTEPLTDEEMMALIAEKAKDHHTLEFILSHDFTREEWLETINRMISYGADINAQEKEMIIDWLVNR
jgi:hypothetical protein